MASYYYLISSLPELSTDGEIPMTYEEFLSCCSASVSEKTYGLLADLSLFDERGPFGKEWATGYGNLMKEINSQRSARLGKAYTKEYDKDSMLAQVASAAFAAKNPLEAEKVLLDFQFELLDTLVGLHTFDDYVLFGYAIKLKLLERQNCFEQTKGKAEFKKLFDEVQQRVYSL